MDTYASSTENSDRYIELTAKNSRLEYHCDETIVCKKYFSYEKWSG